MKTQDFSYLNWNGKTILKTIISSLLTGSLHNCLGIGQQTGNSDGNMLVHFKYSLIRARLVQFGSDNLFDCQNNTIFAFESDDSSGDEANGIETVS